MESACNNNCSPFYHIKRYLKIFHIFLGFPLKPVSSACDEFMFCSVKENIKMFMLLGTFITLHAFSYVFLFKDKDYNYMKAYAAAFKLSTLDVFVAFGEYQICMFTSVCLLYFFYSRSVKKLNLLLSYLKNLNHQLEQLGRHIDHEKIKRHPKVMLLFVYSGRIITSCLACLMWYVVCNGYLKDGSRYDLWDGTSKPLALCSIAISTFVIVNSPLIGSAEFLSIYLLKHLDYNVDAISKLLETKCSPQVVDDKKMSPLKVKYNGNINIQQENSVNIQTSTESFEILTDMSLHMVKIISLFNETFSGTILVLYANSIVILTVSMYGLASIFLSFSRLDDQESLVFAGLRGIWCLLLGTGNIERVVRLTKETNCLQQSMLTLKNNLNHILNHNLQYSSISHLPNLTDSIRNKIWTFKEELYSTNSLVSPFNAFDVSNRTLISAFATITTYLIVLIQFKTSEFD